MDKIGQKRLKVTVIRPALYVMLMWGILSACNKIFDVVPDGVLETRDAYRNVEDADGAIIGIYGGLMEVADQLVILNELRGDLLDVTYNSDPYLIQISEHNVTEENPYIDPRPFYTIINNCNDALYHFEKMAEDNRMTLEDFVLRYSAVGAVRSWLYLKLGTLYGNIPYVTSPLSNIEDLKDPNNFPRLSLDQLLDSLINFTESLPYKEPIPGGTSLVTSVDGYNTEKFFIPIKSLLGDLYLWKGEYNNAAFNYHYMMDYADVLYPTKDVEQWFETYKVAFTANINGANWVNIFSQPFGERYSNYEIIWNLPFDKNYTPKNPFIHLFYNDGTRDSYVLKPSQLAIDNWDKQTRTDNTPGDYRGEDASWKWLGLDPIVNKFISNFDMLNPFETNGKWILYRAAMLHLRYAEAANRDDRNQLANAILNWGMKYEFDPLHLGTSHDSRDVTDIEQSLGSPYDFDARQGDFPRHRGAWHRNTGIRGRVSLPLIDIDSSKYFDLKSPYPKKFLNRISQDSLIIYFENKLMEEGGLELAFEGNRWPDLLRVALRREKESPGSGTSFLQSRIKEKFIAAGNDGTGQEVSVRLSNPKNWFLPFRIK